MGMINKRKQELKGSPSRNGFKYLHKKLSRRFYACDLDFILVGKSPYRIIAFLDYKRQTEPLTFSEIIAFNELKKLAPVFIVRSNNVEQGPFQILRFEGGDPTPDPPVYNLTAIHYCKTWQDLEDWEAGVRKIET
jgi:hypothetical protein